MYFFNQGEVMLTEHCDDLINEFKAELISLEKTITNQMLIDSVNIANLKVKSGRLLNQLNIIITQQGKHWKQVAPYLFSNDQGKEIIKKTSRCERMKVAKIKDVDDYIYLGWAQLALISIYTEEEIGNFLKNHSLTKNDISNKTERELKQILDTRVIKQTLNDNKLSISDETILKSVLNNFKINQKIINKLKKETNPEKALINLIDYSCSNIKNTIKESTKIGELEERTYQLTKLIKLACKKPESVSIPINILENLSNQLNKLILLKKGHSNADISVIPDSKVVNFA